MSPARTTRLAGLLAAALWLTPAPALGWTEEGHETVGALAARRLGPEARAMVREILGDGRLSDHDVALWADDHRDRTNAPWHWVDIPFAQGRYDAARDCPGGMCAVARIEWAARVLAREPDRERRLEALRWLVHVVGDLHQPLHAAEGWRHGNRGGVRVPVHVGQRSYQENLHVVWDAEVVAAVLRGRTPEALAAELDEAAGPAGGPGWLADLSPAAWAGESNRLARAIYAELGVTPARQEHLELPEAYVTAQRGRVVEALSKAGLRLAALLDRIARERSAGAAGGGQAP